jgi:hypothetical protein
VVSIGPPSSRVAGWPLALRPVETLESDWSRDPAGRPRCGLAPFLALMRWTHLVVALVRPDPLALSSPRMTHTLGLLSGGQA